MKRKWLAIGIILLFIGVAIAATINFNTVKASQDDDFVEVTTQACSIQGYRDTTVKLTREQYQNLQESLSNFKERVYQTSSREETNEVFNEFIVELDSYGLLGGLSVKQAQRLVRGISAQYSIHGEAINNTYFLGPLARLPAKILSYLPGLGLISAFAIVLAYFLIPPCLYFATNINKRQIFSNIFYGYTTHSVFPTGYEYFYPASGNVWISGPDGNKSWNGTFRGAIFTIFPYLDVTPWQEYHFGVVGFTGLRIYSNSTNVYFGSARRVAINSV